MIAGFLEIVKTVDPCDEKVCATVLSRPLIIVTTAITAVTPTTIPISVSAVRSLLVRRLEVATRKASQRAVMGKSPSNRGLYGLLKRVEANGRRAGPVA